MRNFTWEFNLACRCPDVHSGIEWAQWVPATAYEGILFGFALFKTFERTISSLRKDTKLSLYTMLLRDNILYFFGFGCSAIGIQQHRHPHSSPFHAAVGIMTTRMLINLRKATLKDVVVGSSTIKRAEGRSSGTDGTLLDSERMGTIRFAHTETANITSTCATRSLPQTEGRHPTGLEAVHHTLRLVILSPVQTGWHPVETEVRKGSESRHADALESLNELDPVGNGNVPGQRRHRSTAGYANPGARIPRTASWGICQRGHRLGACDFFGFSHAFFHGAATDDERTEVGEGLQNWDEFGEVYGPRKNFEVGYIASSSSDGAAKGNWVTDDGIQYDQRRRRLGRMVIVSWTGGLTKAFAKAFGAKAFAYWANTGVMLKQHCRFAVIGIGDCRSRDVPGRPFDLV
ncbi:hypothetical protein C8R47DRAFT_1062859 [Mycena vitilis]|nr:hypothetical protein C8R47DRAFT_1062859 [Mycena vitilis]